MSQNLGSAPTPLEDVVKNKTAPPFKQAEFDIMFDEGISKFGEIVDLGVEKKVIDKAGAWYSYHDERLGQGREAVKTFLKSNPDVAEKIEQQIREKAGLMTTTAQAPPEEKGSTKKVMT